LVADNQQDNTHEKSFHTRLPKGHGVADVGYSKTFLLAILLFPFKFFLVISD